MHLPSGLMHSVDHHRPNLYRLPLIFRVTDVSVGGQCMDASPRQNSRSLASGVAVAGLFLLAAVAGCKDELPLQQPVPAPSVAGMPAGERVYFYDDFQKGTRLWQSIAGSWDLAQNGPARELAPVRRGYALAYAGNPNWSNYRVSAKVTIDDDRQGQAGVVGRGDSDHFYFELVLGRNPAGQKSW